jgi:hypothetical protein
LGKPNFPITTIKFEPLRLKVGAEWQIVVTYPTGEIEHVGGFKSETEAVDWIGSTACLEWVRERGYS